MCSGGGCSQINVLCSASYQYSLSVINLRNVVQYKIKLELKYSCLNTGLKYCIRKGTSHVCVCVYVTVQRVVLFQGPEVEALQRL